MNAASYFESDPWTQATALVRQGAVGAVKAVAVQAVCPRGGRERGLKEWRRRMDGLLGRPIRADALRNAAAVSVLLRYRGPALARLFLDEAEGGPVANFEIVGTAGLLIWKPDVRALSVIHAGGRCELSCEHPYAAALAKERP